MHALDTDHKLFIADVRFKLKALKRQYRIPPMRFHKPTRDQISQYNAYISNDLSRLRNQFDEPSQITVDLISSTLSTNAKLTLPIRHPKQKKDYISQETWRLLELRWSALETQDWDLADTLNYGITQRVKRDKESHLLEQFEQIQATGYQWTGLKRFRSKFTPQFTNFNDSQGNLLSMDNYAQATAKYLQDTQWGSSDPNIHPPHPSREHIPLRNGSYRVDKSQFTLAKLDTVLARIKNNKTPGDDGVVGELFKWLTPINRQYLLEVFNDCLDSQYIAPHHLQAVVVSLEDAKQMTNRKQSFHYLEVGGIEDETLQLGLQGYASLEHSGGQVDSKGLAICPVLVCV